MRDNLRNFMVGLTSIVALLGLAFLLMSFGELDRWVHPRYVLTIETNNALGLRQGSLVEYSGVPIGVVDQVIVNGSTEYPVTIIGHINRGTRIPASVEPHATAPLIGGSARLQLVPPLESQVSADTTDSPPDTLAVSRRPPTNTAYFPDDNSALIRGPMRGGMFEELTKQLDERMKPLIVSLERFNTLSDVYSDLGRDLGKLVKPQTPAELSAGAVQPNLHTAVIRLNEALDQAREGLTLATDFLSDEQLRMDARSAVSKANTLIDQASTAIERYTRLAETLEVDANALTQKVIPVAEQLASTLADVKRVAQLAAEGKGTLGLMLNNPDLYISLNDAAVRLEQALREMRLLIQKMKEEGVIVNF